MRTKKVYYFRELNEGMKLRIMDMLGVDERELDNRAVMEVEYDGEEVMSIALSKIMVKQRGDKPLFFLCFFSLPLSSKKGFFIKVIEQSKLSKKKIFLQ